MTRPDPDPEPSTDLPTPATDLDSWPVFEMDYAIDSTDDGDQCTLYPRDLGEELRGQWIAASVGSFVAVESLR
ncbi:hypothetical protein SAMN04487949_0455 [Halogranum gelatinilyticum]|uniref:DUF7511 domain-containing protein n=1 Tax=Halogranum gelatinilyticum TaxID=660521 RepID=A0A1G9PMX0_9EURY|nr:hypothetical protein [Halogranum gelatinilyticum]SDM00178.1 hypothetical protein SAMN04487949_0455 [Halogranum gelatinilyticum]